MDARRADPRPDEGDDAPAPATTAESAAHERLRNGAVGTLVTAYAFLDDLVLGPVIVAFAVWLPWYFTLGPATGIFTFVNIACCNWVQRSWDSWIHGHGAKLEARLAKLRRNPLLKHPVGWITRDSDVSVTVAGGIIGTVIVVSVIRLLGGETVGHRRVVYASLAYSFGFAVTYTGLGLGADELLRLF
jgi:hypothetical protein